MASNNNPTNTENHLGSQQLQKSNTQIPNVSQPGVVPEGAFFIPYAAFSPTYRNNPGGGGFSNFETASGGFPSGIMFPGQPMTFSPQAPPLLAPIGAMNQPPYSMSGLGTQPTSNTIVFSTDPHLSTTTTTTTGIAEVKLDGNKMTISTNVSPFTPDKLEVKAAENKITIKAKGQEEKDPKTGYVRTKEFHRQYLIPMGCDPEKMKCSYDRGILKIRVVIPERLERLLPIDVGKESLKPIG